MFQRYNNVDVILDQNDSHCNENLLRNVNCQLKLIMFLTFLFNFQEKHRFPSLSLSAEDKIQV